MRPAEEGLLLLCCALGTQDVPLTPAQYRTLARRVRQTCQAGDGEVTPAYLRALGYPEAAALQITALLDRTDTLHRYLEAAAAQGITVLTRLSDGFPARLRRMGETECPPALFCRGDTAPLGTRCVALVGSRQLRPDNRRFAVQAGKLAAAEGFTLVSGGAAGADTAAQEACLAAGGRVICFVPDSLLDHPARQNVLYCSTGGYELPFSTPRALARNCLIHAMGEKTLVAQCAEGTGGTWSGSQWNLAAACRSFTSLTTDRRQARHCSPAERRGCRIFRRLSPCYGPSNCPFSMGNRTKSGKSKFSVDFDKAIVYNLRTTPKIMDLT